jgi:tetratricopeptide (TPR) repeat protein
MLSIPVDPAASAWVARPRVVIYHGPLALLSTCTATLFATTVVVGPTVFGACSGVLGALAAALPWWWSFRRVTRVHNAAVTALGEGDHASARVTFRDVLGLVAPRGVATTALHNLGYLALLAGDFPAAEALLRAAATALGDRRVEEESAMRVLIDTRHAMALARLGRLDDADAALSRVAADSVESHAHLALSRALVDFQRGRHDAVVETLDRARPLIARTLAGEFSLLAVALDAMAVRQLSGIYRGTVRRAAVLPCSDAVRESVERLLPGAADVLPGPDELAA